MVMKQGTIRGYIVSLDILCSGISRVVNGFGTTPKKAQNDAFSHLSKEERLFAYLKVGDARKVKATFKVPLSDILTLKSCTVSDWVPDD